MYKWRRELHFGSEHTFYWLIFTYLTSFLRTNGAHQFEKGGAYKMEFKQSDTMGLRPQNSKTTKDSLPPSEFNGY